MSREKRKVYIYTHVSTSMQIDGYSLEAQKSRMKAFCDLDTSALDQEIANYEKQLRQCFANRDSIMADLDAIDYEDKHYRRRDGSSVVQTP